MEKYLENKRAIIATVVALGAVGFAGYWLYTDRTAPSSDSSASSTTTTSSTSGKKKKNKKKSNKKQTPTSHGFSTTQDDAKGPAYPIIENWAAIESLSDQERKEIAEEFKAAGNHAFNDKEFDRALTLYNQAIQAWGQDAVFYSNRAAVWGSWKKYEEVIKDTTEGLRLRPDYVKCYARRAVAHEHLRQYRDAVMDYTSAVILQNFSDDSLGQSVDRVLRAEAESRIAKEGGSPSTEFPSANFIRAFLQSFHPRELPASVHNAQESQPEYELKLAFDAISKENQESYRQAYDLIKKVTADAPVSLKWNCEEAEALAFEYVATFQSLCNETEAALDSINHSLKVKPSVPAYLKRSAILIEAGQISESEQDFKNAKQLDSENADLYYQLAQVDFLQSKWDSARKNYEHSLQLDPEFTLASVQLAVTDYRMDNVAAAKQRFEQLIKDKPTESQVYNYYGEILLDLKEHDEAQTMFQKAIDLEQTRQGSTINVLPLVNMAMAIMSSAQGPSDVERAVQVCRQAVLIDPQSDVAVGALAQFELQMGHMDEAISLFERSAKLARTPNEQVQAYTFAEAARTQQRIMKERPIVRERLEFLSQMRR